MDKSKVFKMLHDARIKYFTPANYEEGSELDGLVKAIIDRTASNEVLEEFHFACKKEREQEMEKDHDGESKTERINLIISLDASKNFVTTHEIIKDLLDIEGWTNDEIEMLLDIALNNHPVRYLLNDIDVKLFYRKIISTLRTKTEKAKQVEKYFEEG